MIKCSLCPQTFKDNDLLLEERKQRHEDHHNQEKEHGSENQTWGKVEWFEITDDDIPKIKAFKSRSDTSGW